MDFKNSAELLWQFLVGGALISGALFVADILGPALGGAFSALPIRVGSTVLIGGVSDGGAVALEMAKGGLAGVLGSFFFALSMSYLPSRIGTEKSIAFGLGLCLVVIYVAKSIVVAVL